MSVSLGFCSPPSLNDLRESAVIEPHVLAAGGNRLLPALSPRALAGLAPHCRRVVLGRGEVVSRANQPAEAALFIEYGVASVVKAEPRSDRVEICLTGPEGFCGSALVTGDGRWPYETFVQTDELTAIAVDAAPFRARVADDEDLRRVLLGAVQAQMVQVAEGLASAANRRLPSRLARWLLMYRDRVGGDRLELTHEFMALMVGAQRTGVTAALHGLEGDGLIAAQRGVIVVRDAAGLKSAADGGYGVAESEHRRLLQRCAAHPA